MNKIKLPSMVEYVVIQRNNDRIDLAQRFINSFEFADFLSQEPNIGMFVPAVEEDGEWRVLEKYLKTDYEEHCDKENICRVISKEEIKYQTALDNVIFEGFEVEQILNSGKIFLINEDTICLTFLNNSVFIEKNLITSLEQLTHYNLTITPKFAKELGLI
jgi:hypothetical protein